MELKRYLLAMWKWWWLIALATIVAAGISYQRDAKLPPVYQTAAIVRVGQIQESLDPQSNDFNTSSQLAGMYAESVRRQPILQGTLNALGLKWPWQNLANNVYASVVGGQLIQISVWDNDPRRAKALADEIAHQLILSSPTAQENKAFEQQRQFVNQQLADIQNRTKDAQGKIEALQNQIVKETSASRIQESQSQIAALQAQITSWQGTYASLLAFYKGGQTNYLEVLQPAPVPAQPLGSSTLRDILIAAAVGFFLASGAAVIMFFFEDPLNTTDDVDRVVALPILGSIPNLGRIKDPKDSLERLEAPHSPIAEAYHVLRTNLQFACTDENSRMLMVTSPDAQEGKSVTAGNLAVSFAQAGKQVVLVDADLRHPSVYELFGKNNTGLTTDRSQAYLMPTEIPNLRIMSSGSMLPNPAEVIESTEFTELLKGLTDLADIVIVDSPPLLPVADAAVLAGKGLGVLLVVEAGKTRSQSARLACETLSRAHARVLGVALNKAPRAATAYYYHYAHRAEYRDHPFSLGKSLNTIAGYPKLAATKFFKLLSLNSFSRRITKSFGYLTAARNPFEHWRSRTIVARKSGNRGKYRKRV